MEIAKLGNRVFHRDIARSIWRTRVPYGDRGFHMEFAGSIWRSRVPYEDRGFHMEIAGSIWRSRVPYGNRAKEKTRGNRVALIFRVPWKSSIIVFVVEIAISMEHAY